MPTPDEGSQYGTLAKELEKVLSSMKWIKRWPNQLIRVCHHNSVFLNDPEGTGSVGPHCTEPLESAARVERCFQAKASEKFEQTQKILSKI